MRVQELRTAGFSQKAISNAVSKEFGIAIRRTNKRKTDRFVVHGRSEPWKKKNYTQEVEVYFNFVGKV